MEDKKLEMKELTGEDLFSLLKILSKVKVKDLVVSFIKERDEIRKKDNSKLTEEEIKNVGVEVMANIVDMALSNLDYAKEDINKLLAKLCDATVKEIKSLGIAEYMELLMDFFAKEELPAFLNSIFSSKLFKNLK